MNDEVNNEIVKSIKNLPMIPDAVHKIQRVCSNPHSSISDVIKIVETDPILTANLLRAANSPLYGFSREVTSIAQAVSLFGMSTVKGFAIVAAVKSRMRIDLSPYFLTDREFLRIASEQNAFMVRWMSRIDKQLLDILAPASFLLEIGMIVLSTVLIETGQADAFKEELKKNDFKNITKIERDFLKISSYEAASALFEYWNFDESLVQTIFFTEYPQKAPKSLWRYCYPLAILQRVITPYAQCQSEQLKSVEMFLIDGQLNMKIFKEELLTYKKLLLKD
ncbi:HDOD domain-containing protein [Helicobacter monodelphidis]|uniref:HDOD domain-containing protein n=1 Tax=Helicobacter sp. 15-1451 TaxID=2004995 RepID=UPI0015EBABE1|nr:HDOD domain-containing protein [Helicobacter sp. 15-1451]